MTTGGTYGISTPPALHIEGHTGGGRGSKDAKIKMYVKSVSLSPYLGMLGAFAWTERAMSIRGLHVTASE